MEYTQEVKSALIEEGKDIHLRMLRATELPEVEELLALSTVNVAKLTEFSESGSDAWTEFDSYMLMLILQADKQLREAWETEKHSIN